VPIFDGQGGNTASAIAIAYGKTHRTRWQTVKIKLAMARIIRISARFWESVYAESVAAASRISAEQLDDAVLDGYT
jgi:hypothetical protein